MTAAPAHRDLMDLSPVAELAMVLLGVGLLWLVVEDIRRFEISPAAAILTAGGLLSVLTAAGQNPLPSILVALAASLIALALHRWNPAALGQGDITLFGLIGLASGPDFAALTATAFAAASLAVATAYLIIRKKPLRLASYRRYLCPAAPAGCIAILTGLSLNLA